jgi:aryl-alcohol dehydrogenase-like predicted oxidoreductase
VVKQVAAEAGTTASRVALAWTLANPAVTAPTVGVRRLAHLDDNLGDLGLELSEEQLAQLDR